MNFEKLVAYLQFKKGSSFDYPFDDKVRVYRVCGKIFALVGDSEPLAINLKCNPLYAQELRSLHKSIKPGYHMDKKHWNTVETGGDVDDMTLEELIDHSYSLVVAGLTKKQREGLV